MIGAGGAVTTGGRMIRRHRTPLLALAFALLAWALPAQGAAAAACTGMPHDAATPVHGNNNEFDVTCDTAIANGGFNLRINRGGSVDPAAQVTNGTGALTCRSNVQGPGSQFQDIIACTGSLSANATAKVFATLGPNPCSSPPFTGDLSVGFGDGTTFGPSPLAAYPCSGGGGGGSPCDVVRSGRGCDPGGVFQGVTKKPPARATVAAARTGLKFELKLGVKGTAVVTIEVRGRVVGTTSRAIASGKVAKLTARLTRAAATQLAHHTTYASIHVEVKPNAAAEGFSTHGRKYFSLKLTG
jgi:hypothetical protein